MGATERQLQSLAAALILAGSLAACKKVDTQYTTTENAIGMPKPKLADREKCYGIAKAQFNDCAAGPGTDCAGTASKDNMPDRWKYVPTGKCVEQGGTLKRGRLLPETS